MEYQKLRPLKDLAVALDISENDAYNLVVLSKNKVEKKDGEDMIADFTYDLAIMEYDNYVSIAELERLTGISEGDIKYMCECNIEYDLPEYMKIRPVSLCGTYYLHISYLEHFIDRFQAFAEEADEIMYKIDMGINDDEVPEMSDNFAISETIDDANNEPDEDSKKDPDDDIIEEIIITEEEETDKKKSSNKKKPNIKTLEEYRKLHEQEVARAVAARLKDEAYSKQNGLARAENNQKLIQYQITEEELLAERKKKQEEYLKIHKDKLNDIVGDKYNTGNSTTGAYAAVDNIVEEYKKNRQKIKEEQERKQRELDAENSFHFSNKRNDTTSDISRSKTVPEPLYNQPDTKPVSNGKSSSEATGRTTETVSPYVPPKSVGTGTKYDPKFTTFRDAFANEKQNGVRYYGNNGSNYSQSTEKPKHYLDDNTHKELKKEQNEQRRDTVAGVAGSMVQSVLSQTEVGYGVVKVAQGVRAVSSIASIAVPINFDKPTMRQMQTAMQQNITKGTSTQGVYLRAMHKQAELNINKVNTVFERYNSSVKEVKDRFKPIDASLGLKVNTRAINQGSKEFQELLKKHNITPSTITKNIADKMIKENPKLRDEITSHIRLNNYLQKNNINLSDMDKVEVALMLNSIKEKGLRNSISQRTGVAGFENKLNIIQQRRGNHISVSTLQIKQGKEQIAKFLAKKGVIVRNRSERHLAALLRRTTDEDVKTLLQGYLGLGSLEKGMSIRMTHKFRRGIKGVIRFAERDLSKDDAFNGAYTIARDIRLARHMIDIPVITYKTLRYMTKKVLKITPVNRLSSASKRALQKVGDSVDGIITKRVQRAFQPYDRFKSSQLERLRKNRQKYRNRLKEARKRTTDKITGSRVGKGWTRATNTKLGKGAKKVTKGVGKGLRGVGKVGKGFAKILGAVGKIATKLIKVFSSIGKYLLIGLLIIVATLLLFNALIWGVAKVGTIVTNFFENIWYDSIEDSEAFQALNTLEGYDKKFFNAIESVADLSDVSGVVGNRMHGFINATQGQNTKYNISLPGAYYGNNGFEQHYYNANGQEISRYSNAKDILCVSYAAFDGKVSAWQQMWDNYKSYNANLWVKTHRCTTCGKLITTEHLILSDEVDIHCHPSYLYACQDGICDGTHKNTYTYYCNTLADSDYQTTEQKNTFWVYSVPLFNNSMKVNALTNTTNYLCVIYGDGKNYSQSLHPAGKGCTTVYCSKDAGSFVPVKLYGLSKDKDGKELGYYLPKNPNGGDCKRYGINYCSGCKKVHHDNDTINNCPNALQCANKSVTEKEFANVTAYDSKGNVAGTIPKLTLKLSEWDERCTNSTAKTVTKKYEVTSKGKTYYVELTYDVITCQKHCYNDTVCPGHTTCVGHSSCKGHTMTYCTGHIDLYSTIEIASISDDKMYEYADSVAQNNSQKFDDYKRDYAQSIYDNDWADLYNIYFSNNAIPTPLAPSEISDLNPTNNEVVNNVLICVGSVPYHETYSKSNTYHKKDDLSIFLNKTSADSRGRILTGLTEETFGSYILWNQGYVSKYYFAVSTAISNSHLTQISKEALKPGDMAYNSKNGKIGFIISKNGSNYKMAICSNQKSAVVIETVDADMFNIYYSLN